MEVNCGPGLGPPKPVAIDGREGLILAHRCCQRGFLKILVDLSPAWLDLDESWHLYC